MSNSQKGFSPIFIVLGIVLLLGIAGGVYFFGKTAYLKLNCPFGIVVNNECGWNWTPPPSLWQPSSSPTPSITPKVDETANWKTYTNTKYKFEFRYPNYWKVSEDAGFSFIQLQGIKDGKIDSINGGITIIDKMNSRNSTYRKMFVSDIRCPIEAGKIDLSDTTNVYCLTGKDITTDVGIWKAAVECSSSQFYGLKINPENCPHQFWQDTKDFFYIVHFNFFEPIIKGSNNEIFFKQFLSTFKFFGSNAGSGKYTCPENGYQNCMPILDAEGQKQCSSEALDWKKVNCPNFSGAAY
jgi:hypothetical protein